MLKRSYRRGLTARRRRGVAYLKTAVPRRRALLGMIRLNEARVREMAEAGFGFTAGTGTIVPPPSRPLGIAPVAAKTIETAAETSTVRTERLMGYPVSVRTDLGRWMPPSLKDTKLDLLYSTDLHGRSLTALYDKCKGTRRTVVLIEVLPDDDVDVVEDSDDGKEDAVASVPVVKGGDNRLVVGMYATRSWSPSPNSYGDGGCILFRLGSDKVAYGWNPVRTGVSPSTTTSSSSSEGGRSSSFFDDNSGDVSEDDDDVFNAFDVRDDDDYDPLSEQFQVCRPTFMSMGGNANGGAGLRLNSDLTGGESDAAVGFDNEPLAVTEKGRRRRGGGGGGGGKGGGTEFDVGAVEVYRFLREADGGPVDGEKDPVWDLGGM